MNPKFSVGLNFALAVLFGAGAIYTFLIYKDVGSSILMLIFCIFSLILGLKYLKKINSIKFLDPLLIKDENNQPIIPVSDSQLGISKVNTLPLTPEQQSFVNHYSISGSFLGMWYYIYSGLTKEGLKQLIPIYGDIQQLKALNWGRKIVWESVAWKDFETYKRKQVKLDTIAIIVLAILISIAVAMVLYEFGDVFKSPEFRSGIGL